jgi:branched-chain amino acid aminotransferase
MTTHDAEHDPRNDALQIWLNGTLKPKAEAVVSVYDAGFMLGDGVWEGLRLHHGRWAFLDAHLDRLLQAAKVLALDIGMDRAGLKAALDATAAANGMTGDAHARLMVTRGPKARPFQHPSLSRAGPTVVVICEHSRPAPPARGIRLATVPIVRGTPVSQDPKLNSHSKLNCILAGLHAAAAGADEALMLDPAGFVNTTNSCNVVFVRKGELWTSTGDYCLCGITRGHVLRLARGNGMTVHERNFSLVEAYDSEEAFLTGSFGGLTPVASLDGHSFGDGGAGPITRRLQALYADLVERDTGG